MEELAEKLEYEDHIDPETGEFHDPDFEVGSEPKLSPDHLPGLARRISHDMKRLHLIHDFRDREISRIQECCAHRITALQNQISYCTEILAKPLVLGSSMEFPGLGKFRFHKGREYVDEEAYQKMTPEERTDVQSERPGCFKRTITITPDKKTIKVQLEHVAAGRSYMDIPGFEIKRHPEVFRFEPEKDV